MNVEPEQVEADDEPTAASPAQLSGIRQILRLVVAALWKHWGLGLLIFVGLLIDMSFSAAVPMSFKYLLDYAIVPRNGEILVLILAGLAGGVVLAAGAYIGCDYLYAKFTTGVLNDLRWEM